LGQYGEGNEEIVRSSTSNPSTQCAKKQKKTGKSFMSVKVRKCAGTGLAKITQKKKTEGRTGPKDRAHIQSARGSSRKGRPEIYRRMRTPGNAKKRR